MADSAGQELPGFAAEPLPDYQFDVAERSVFIELILSTLALELNRKRPWPPWELLTGAGVGLRAADNAVSGAARAFLAGGLESELTRLEQAVEAYQGIALRARELVLASGWQPAAGDEPTGPGK